MKSIILVLTLLVSGCATAPQYHCEEEGKWTTRECFVYDDGSKICEDPIWIKNGKWDCVTQEGD